MSEIKLTRWVSNEVEFIQKFENWWLERQRENPDEYPERMAQGEWDEQFQIYCETEAGL